MEKWQRLSLIVLLLDQTFKLVIIKYFSSLLVVNRGVSFGLWASNLWLLVNLVIILGLYFLFKDSWVKGLIIGGGISNLFDRLIRGAVIDYLHLGFLPIFNLADVFICLGVIMLIINIIKTV